ncbi:hypothetical protein ACQKWADRAFT_299984 [Trichoderma austrokoningii]
MDMISKNKTAGSIPQVNSASKRRRVSLGLVPLMVACPPCFHVYSSATKVGLRVVFFFFFVSSRASPLLTNPFSLREKNRKSIHRFDWGVCFIFCSVLVEMRFECTVGVDQGRG